MLAGVDVLFALRAVTGSGWSSWVGDSIEVDGEQEMRVSP